MDKKSHGDRSLDPRDHPCEFCMINWDAGPVPLSLFPIENYRNIGYNVEGAVIGNIFH
jgi:hypothetical protein